MSVACSQEIVLRALVFAGAYSTHTFHGQTGPEVCRWLLDTLPDGIWQKVGAGRVYDVPFEHWWKAFRHVFDHHGHLDELQVSGEMEASEILERMGGRLNVGRLYYAAANTGWLYLSDMDGLRGHVDKILQAAQQRRT
jgi:hypothetical protein